MARKNASICAKKFIAPFSVPELFKPISVHTAYDTITPNAKKALEAIRQIAIRLLYGNTAARNIKTAQAPSPVITVFLRFSLKRRGLFKVLVQRDLKLKNNLRSPTSYQLLGEQGLSYVLIPHIAGLWNTSINLYKVRGKTISNPSKSIFDLPGLMV